MSESESKRGPSTSPSRLSASARPFTFNRSNNPHHKPVSSGLDLSLASSFNSSLIDNWQHVTRSASLADDSFSNPCLDAVAVAAASIIGPYGYYGPHSDATTVAAFPNDYSSNPESNPYYTSLPSSSSDFALLNDWTFDALLVSDSPQIDYTQDLLGSGFSDCQSGVGDGPAASYGGQGSSVDVQGCLLSKQNNVNYSMTYDGMLKEGKCAVEGLKSEAFNSSQRKSTGILGEVNQIRSKGTEQITAEFNSSPMADSRVMPFSLPTSTALCSTAQLKDPQSQLTGSETLVVGSQGNSSIASSERCFSELYLCVAEPKVSLSSESNPFPAPITETSSTTDLSHNLIWSKNPKNVDPNGQGVVSKSENNLNCNPAEINKPHGLLNAEDKEVYHDKILINKGKGIEYGKPIIDEVDGPLLTGKSELQITCSSVHDEFLKPHGAEAGVSVEKFSIKYDGSDSDLDSPCWKGTQHAYKSTFANSEPLNSQLPKEEIETCSSLNPLAPLFFPGSVKLTVDEDACNGDALSSSQKTAASVVTLLSREPRVIETLNAESSPSEVRNIVGVQCSNNIHEPAKEHNLLNNLIFSSVLSSSSLVEPLLVDDYFTSNGQPVIGPGVGNSVMGAMDAVLNSSTAVSFLATKHVLSSSSTVAGPDYVGSVKGVEDAVHNASTSVSFLATEHVLSSSSSTVGVPSYITETFRGATKSLSTPPELGVKRVVNTMHYLSELLVQNCSYDLDSLNEHEHDIIQRVIDNLNLYIRNRVGQRTQMPQSRHPCTSYCPIKSADVYKCSNIDFQVTRAKGMTFSSELDHRTGQDRLKSCSTSFGERSLVSFSPNSAENIQKGDNAAQVMEKALEDNHETEEEMHPRALLYRKLWLEAEAALCFMKYKVHRLHMETGIDRSK